MSDSCTDTVTELSRAQAQAVLEPYFIAIQEIFVDAGYNECSKVRFSVRSDMHDTPRHFAAATEDGKQIFFAPEAVELPEHTVLAIMAHEFGHICDFARPACHVLDGNGLTVRRKSECPAKQWNKWLTAWEERDYDCVERTADAIAESVMGATIGYSGPCMLQTFLGGKPRPTGLR